MSLGHTGRRMATTLSLLRHGSHGCRGPFQAESYTAVGVDSAPPPTTGTVGGSFLFVYGPILP